jgi:hypothetical protein
VFPALLRVQRSEEGGREIQVLALARKAPTTLEKQTPGAPGVFICEMRVRGNPPARRLI